LLLLDAEIIAPLFLREALMDPIIVDWRYIVIGLGVLDAIIYLWHHILMEEIWEECRDLAENNRDMMVKIEVLKAGRR